MSTNVARSGAAIVPHVAVVIPARFESTRFPGKVLADRTGKPMIQHVYEQAQRSMLADVVIVATDDDRIARAVRGFDGQVAMTRNDHPNGTSRIAEAADSIEADVIVNVQGDEPEIEPSAIDLVASTLLDNESCSMSTLACPFADGEDPSDPNIVKVVIDQAGHALYFSRAAIPVDREGNAPLGAQPLRHLGIYAYRKPFLKEYITLPATPLEQAERLEQLRALESGFEIAVAITQAMHCGVDTPEQYDAFVRRIVGS